MADRAGSSSSRDQVDQLKPNTIAYYISKIRQGGEAKWDKDELLNVIYWWRQLSGVLFGVLLALGDVTGFFGVLLFAITSVAFTLGIIKSVLGIENEEEFGGLSELLFEGMAGSFAAFMVSWILVYSALQ